MFLMQASGGPIYLFIDLCIKQKKDGRRIVLLFTISNSIGPSFLLIHYPHKFVFQTYWA